MFQTNSRIEKNNGIKFYEKDILFDDYTYTNDIQIVLDIDYLSPGIGIALMNNEGKSLIDQEGVYLFRTGYRDASVLYRFGETIKKLSTAAVTLRPPVEGMKLIFTKTGRTITLEAEGYGILIDYALPINMDKYSIGIYSNAGNVLKSISVASSIPNNWSVNMKNANGGHLKFVKNGFILEDCENPAEIEQTEIMLKPGWHYLGFEKDDSSDIESFVMLSSDERLYDSEKNILDSDNKFYLSQETKVNLKLKGKQGIIRDIFLSDSTENRYAATRGTQTIVEGSSVTIDVSNLSKVMWTGTVHSIASFSSSFAIIHGFEMKTNMSLGVESGKSYEYEYDAVVNSITIYSQDNKKYFYQFMNKTNTLIVFKNMDASISKLTLVQFDGKTTDLVSEKTTKKYVPSSINSPIIVVNDEDIPLDLSSSYRVYQENGKDRYLFTNWEREIFEPKEFFKIEKKISTEIGTVKVYGILQDSKVDMNNIFRIENKNFDSIGQFASHYKEIDEQDLSYLNKESKEIYVTDWERYKYFVVDYLKRDSYCINLIKSTGIYEVDISCNDSETFLVYDSKTEVSNGISVSQALSYKTTGLVPENKRYVVLKREGF